MATKKTKNKSEFDEFGEDFDLGFDDSDFDFEPPKDDRKPITQVKDGFIDGAKNTVFSNDFVKKFIENSLPPGYESLYSTVETVSNEGGKLYNNASQEIKKTNNELKKTAKKILPKLEGKLPKSIQEKMAKWADSAESDSLSQIDTREANIQLALGDIFKAQTEQNNADRTEDKVREVVKDKIETGRYKDQIEQLSAIRNSADSLVQFNQSISTQYYRKSLELQFRHYYASVDLLEEQKKANIFAKDSLASIAKNTGLPEYVKLENSERFGDMMRSKFINRIYDAVFDSRSGYLSKSLGRLGKSFNEKTKDFFGNFRDGLSSTNDQLDTMNSAAEMGGNISEYEIGGNVAGSMAADELGNYLGKKLGNKLKDSKYYNTIKRGSDNLEYGIENIAQFGNRFANGQYDYEDSIVGKVINGVRNIPFIGDDIVDILQDAARVPSKNNTVIIDDINNLQSVSIFTNQTRKSITEIIPGYLARIYQELQIIRSGDDAVALTQYDFKNNKFDTQGNVFKSTLGGLVNSYSKDSFGRSVNELIDQFDPQKKLSENERLLVAGMFLKDNLANRLPTPENYINPDNFKSDIDSKTKNKLSSLIKNQYGFNENGQIVDRDKFSAGRLNFSRKFSSLGSELSDVRKDIQNLINLGFHEELKQAGILTNDFKINEDVLNEYLIGNKTLEPLLEKAKKVNITSNQFKVNTAQEAVNQDNLNIETQNTNSYQKAVLEYHTKHLDYQEKILKSNQALEETTKSFLTIYTEARETQSHILTSNVHIEELINDILETMPKEITINVKRTTKNKHYHQAKRSKKDKSNERWYEKSIGDILGYGADGIRSGIEYGADKAKYLGNKLKDFTGNTLNFAFDKAKKTKKFLFDKYDQFVDVYIEGEALPRLLAWKLEAGEYIDQATGKVIKSYADIKGTVLDKAGNIVLTKEELSKIIPLNIKNRFNKGLSKLVGLGKSLFDKSLSGYEKIFNVTSSVFNTTKSFVMDKINGHDVYVVGETEPKLLAITMRAGGYRSRLTGKTIWRALQIDGPVIDTDNNIVLSDDDLRKGIVDKDGKPFRNPLLKAFDKAKNIGKFVLTNLKKGAEWVWDKASDIGSNLFNFLRYGGIDFKNSDSILDRLTEIRDILDQRLNKTMAGDLDGDGDRENSWQDRLQKREAKEKLAKENKESKEKDSESGIGKMKSVLSGLFNKNKDKEEEEDEDGSLLDDAADIAEIGDFLNGDGEGKKSGKKGKKLKGKAGRFGRFFKGTGKLLGRGLAGAGGLLLRGGGLLARGAMGAAGIVSTPVVLGATAAYAGYKAYQYFTRQKLNTLSTYRFAQYGFNAKNDNYGIVFSSSDDALQSVFNLEETLLPYVKVNGEKASISDEVKFEDLLKLFNIGEDNKGMISRFTRWFNYRFKPVFLNHVAVLKSINPSVKLSQVDSGLKKDQKLAYFNASQLSDGPYSEYTSPIEGLKRLTVGPSEVKEAGEICKKALQTAGNSSAVSTAIASTTATATVLSAKAGTEISGMNSDNDTYNKSALTNIKNTIDKQNTADMGIMVSISSSNVINVINREKVISPLNSIRFRSYGLYELESEKINSLLTLEFVVNSRTVINKDKAVWNGNLNEIIEMVGHKFGVANFNTLDGENFARWFNARFLPIYLNFITAIYQFTGKKTTEQLNSLTASQKLAVANVIYTTRTSFDGRSNQSIWTVGVSPWPGYKININEGTVHETVQKLSTDASEEIVKETIPVAKPDALTKQIDSVKSNADTQKDIAKVESDNSVFSKTKNWVSSTYKNVSESVSNIGNTMVDGAKNVYKSAKDAATTAVNFLTGSGGTLDQIPMPKGDGSWDALKDTILSASKIVGVDPKLMAVMAAVESGFRTSVKAGTSSATGIYQFIQSTWNEMLQKYGSKFGISLRTSPTDPRANALMGAQFLKDNMAAIQPALKGRTPTYTDLYLAHFMGAGGARQFLSADQNAIGAQLFPKQAAANVDIFYADGKAKQQPKTLGQIYNDFTGKLNRRVSQFKIDGVQVAANDSNIASTTSTPKTSTTITPSPQAAAVMAAAQSTQNNANSGFMKTSAVVNQTPSAPSIIPTAQNNTTQTAVQTKASSEEFNKSMGTIDSTLLKSLEVQKAQLTVLENIFKTISKQPINSTVQKDSQPVEKPLVESIKAPVSMKRQA